MVDSVYQEFGRIDILVNNAGVVYKPVDSGGASIPTEDVSPDNWEHVIKVNLFRHQLVLWFEKYVNPSMDGTRFPVTGSGQKDRITPDGKGEGCFYADRLIMDKNGFPKINP